MRGHNCIWRSLCDVPCADDGQSWPLEFCDTCGLVRLARLPSPGEAYPATYYGTGRKKFLPGVEFLSHLSPALMNAAVSLAAAAAHRPRRPRVLDVGCGRGYLLRRFKALGWSPSGIDIEGSPLPIDDEGLDCHRAGAASLPWPDETFDLVVINHVLEHVAEPWTACAEAARVLRPNGVLYVGVPNFGSIQSRLFGSYWFPLEIPRHVFHFKSQPLRALVGEAGFSIVRQSTRSFRQGVFAFLQSTLNWLDSRRQNLLLSVLKGQTTAMTFPSLCHVAAAALLLPIAFAETTFSWILGRGSVIILVCRKLPAVPPSAH